MKVLIFSMLLLGITAGARAQDYWKPVVSGTTKHLYCVSFGDARNGYIGGSDSTFLKSTDGGLNWTPLKTSGIHFSAAAPDMVDLKFVDANTGFAVVGHKTHPLHSGMAYKTTDGGLHWTELKTSMLVSRVYCFGPDNAWLLGAATGNVLAKYSGGSVATPFRLDSDPARLLLSADFFNKDTGIVGDNLGQVFRTFDGGKSWSAVKTPVDSSITGLHYLNDKNIVAAYAHIKSWPYTMVSTDRGLNWKEGMRNSFQASIRSMAFSHKDSFVYAGSTGGMGVMFWRKSDFKIWDHPLHATTVRNDSIAFAVGDNGQIISNARSILHTEDLMPLQLVASIYPNPGTGLFTCKMNQPHTLSVYNLSGREVWSGGNAAIEHNIDLQERPKGIYIAAIRIVSSGQVLHTRITLQ